MWATVIIVALITCILHKLITVIYDQYSTPLNKLNGPTLWSLDTLRVSNIVDITNYPGKVFMDWAMKYGDIVYYRFSGFKNTLMVTNTEVIKFMTKTSSVKKLDSGLGDITGTHGLLITEGVKHKSHRKILEQCMKVSCVKNAFPQMINVVDQFLELLADGDTINVKTELTRLTLDMIGKVSLGYDFGMLSNKNYKNVLSDLNNVFETMDTFDLIMYQCFGKIWRYLPTKKNLKYFIAKRRLDNLITKVYENGVKQNTMEHTDSGDSNLQQTITRLLIMNQKNLSKKDITDNILTFMLAGHETTASAISWLLYLLCKHPEIKEKLKHAIDISHTGEITYNTIVLNKYLDYCVKEALRLHPPVPLVAKETLNSIHVETSNGTYEIPTGTIILISPEVQHKHPDYWHNPNEFNPDRWSGSFSPKPYTYMPFMWGPRSCIGKKIAIIEIKMIVTKFLMTFDFKCTNLNSVNNHINFTSKPKNFNITLKKY